VGMAGMALALPFGLPKVMHLISQAAPGSGEAYYAATSIPFFGKYGRIAWDKGMKIIRRLLEALSLWLKQPRALLAGLALTWIHMLCLFTFLWLLFDGMNQHISFLLVGGLYSIVYFVTLMPVSVNGYGLQELSMTLIFSSFGGASMSSGLTAALLFRTLMMVASLPGVLFVPEMMADIKLTKPGTV
jgi:glycosyltransferase 2 family protein